jgi:hypothetical protein
MTYAPSDVASAQVDAPSPSDTSYNPLTRMLTYADV